MGGAAKCAGVLDFLPRHHVKVISESCWKWRVCSSGLSLFFSSVYVNLSVLVFCVLDIVCNGAV